MPLHSHVHSHGAHVLFLSCFKVSLLALDSVSGDIAAHSWASRTLAVFSVNGHQKAAATLPDRQKCLVYSRAGGVLIGGGSQV